MAKKSRDKGARYERRIANVLNDALGWDLVRNLEQSRRDIHGDLVDRTSLHAPHNMIIELKYRQFSWENVIKWNSEVKASPVHWLEYTLEKDPSKTTWLIFKHNDSQVDFSMIYCNTSFYRVAESYIPIFDGWTSGRLLLSKLESAIHMFQHLALDVPAKLQTT